MHLKHLVPELLSSKYSVYQLHPHAQQPRNKETTMRTIILMLLALFLFVPSSLAQDSSDVLALKPEVQTAKWAKSWWMPRHKQKLEDMKKQKEVDLLFIGDSITHGFENKGKIVWMKYYAPRNAFNIGFSGDRTEQVIWRIQNGAVDGISPKLAVIMIGTNNTGHRKDKPEHTAAGIKKIIEELQTRLKTTKILLLAVFPRDEKPDGKFRVINDGVNKVIKGLANDKKGVFFLDIGDKFLDEKGNLPKSIMPDRLHPNEKGYEIWAKAMEPTIKKLMGES